MFIQFFSGTHWDREWYQDFQGYRMRLVKMTDKLIEGLETEDYGVFHFDGQTIVLEDYLDIRPENAERLKKLIRDGKILIGPWYVMPDEYLLSGESLIKNIKKGHKISRSFGVEPLKYGYVCDIFGHIAQMPQIFKGFGIDQALLGRGTNESTTPMYFVWESPDGSSVATFKLFDSEGYGGFTSSITRDENIFNELTAEDVREKIKAYADYEVKRANIPVIVMMDALDHIGFHKNTKMYIDILKELYPDAEVSHQSIMNMCKKVDEYKDTLPVKKGELNEPAKVRANYIHLISHTMSSRYPIKKFNDRVQTLSEKTVSPMYAFNMVDMPISYLELADKYLLQNHPHDSIGCCGIDKIYKDMEYRYSQAEAILNGVTEEFSNSLHVDCDTSNIAMKVYNPLPYEYSGGIELEIYFPKDYPEKYREPFGYEDINSFKIYDDRGAEIPYNVAEITTNYTKRVYNQETQLVDIYRVVFDGKLIPMGVTEFIVKPFSESSRYLEKMPQGDNWAENEYLRLDIDKNGGITLLDKRTNTKYTDLLELSSDGEIGDGWYHVNPANDFSVWGGSCTVKKILSGVERAVFEIRHIMKVPEKMEREKYGIRRSNHEVDLEIVHRITLQKSAEYLDVKTYAFNNAKDHRIRLKVATGIEGKTYFSSQPFCFVGRVTDVDINTQSFNECEVPEKQMSGIVLKKCDKNSLAFVSAYGIHEGAVFENGDMYITLYRCFSNSVMDIAVPDAQLQEEMEFSYRIVPQSGDVSVAKLQKMQDVLACELVYTQCNGNSAEKHESVMEVLGDNIVYSTAEREDSGANIRLYNDSNEESTAEIRLQNGYTKCSRVDLDNNEIGGETLENGVVKLKLRPWEIGTISVK